MKHLNLFEDNFDKFGTLEIKANEYQRYIGKYVVLEFEEELFIAKITSIDLDTHLVKMDYYEWNNDDYNIKIVNEHLSELNILESFDTFEYAEIAYNRLLTTKNYNL